MSSVQVFSVLSEFKFEIADALANSERLQETTKSLSDAADKALISVQNLGLGFTNALIGGGVIGFFKKALESSDAFQGSMLDLTGVLTANMGSLTGPIDTFNQRLAVSKQTLQQIADTSDQLNINSGDVLETFKTLLPSAITLDENITTKDLTAISGQSAAGASAIGLSPSQMATQVGEILSSSATQGALINVLQTMPNAFKGKSLGQINGMADDEILKRLSAGLKELSGNMSDVAERANMFSTQMAKFKNLIFGDENGMGGLFKPIGDAIKPVLVDIFKGVNGYLKVQGTQIVGSFTQLIKSFISTPKEMFADVMQMKNTHSDLGKAVGVLGTASAIEGIGQLLAKFTKVAAFGNPIIGALAAATLLYIEATSRAHSPIADMTPNLFRWVGGLGMLSGALVYFGVFMKVVGFAIAGVLLPLTIMFGIMQAMSRAKAKADFDSGIDAANMLPQFTDLAVRLKMAVHNIILPFSLMVDGLAQIMQPFFMWSNGLSKQLSTFQTYVALLEAIGNAMTWLFSALSGVFDALFGILLSIKEKGVLHMFDDLGKNFNEGFDDFMKGHKQKMDEGKNVSNSNVYINKVEINNDLKAGMEPDRIAYTIQDQLLKSTQNINKAKGQSLQKAYAAKG